MNKLKRFLISNFIFTMVEIDLMRIATIPADIILSLEVIENQKVERKTIFNGSSINSNGETQSHPVAFCLNKLLELQEFLRKKFCFCFYLDDVQSFLQIDGRHLILPMIEQRMGLVMKNFTSVDIVNAQLQLTF